MDIDDFADAIETKKDFDQFLEMLLISLRKSNSDWENKNLEDYIDGLWGFTKSIDGYYLNRKETVDLEHPTWKMIAVMLLAATVFE